MRVLMVSNLYPPYYRGGYELRCAEVASGLRRRGHELVVLTSTFGLPSRPRRRARRRSERISDVTVHRALGEYAYGSMPVLAPWTLTRAWAELTDARWFLRLLDQFRPDVVNWWSMNGLSKTLLPIPAARRIPDVHCIDDPWMVREFGPDGAVAAAFWSSLWDGRWGPPLARPLLRRLGAWWESRVRRESIPTRQLPNRPRHVCFESRFLEDYYREAGFRFDSTEVIHGGIPVARFLAPGRIAGENSGPLRVLYAGQISRDRGLHTAVDAIGGLDSAVRSQVTLTAVGDDTDDYATEIRNSVAELGLGDRVHFRGMVRYEDMPAVYREHDVLVFTSTRPEGLGFTAVEAMLSGCGVLTTGSGGAMDVAIAAGLPMFPKGDAVALGRLLVRLVSDRPYLREIAARGQLVAQREFNADLMVDRLESMLLRIASSGETRGSAKQSG